MVTGLPLTSAVVALFPLEPATTSVLPVLEGVGVCKGRVITRLVPMISAFKLISFSGEMR